MMSNAYAEALVMLGREQGELERMREDVEALSCALAENPDCIRLLDTPALTKDERLGIAESVSRGLLPSVSNTLMLLTESRMAYAFFDIAQRFYSLYDEQMGILRVSAITAKPMSAAQIKALTDKLASKTGKTVIVNNEINPEILGGVKLRYMGRQIDGSLKTRLDSIAEGIRTTVI
jgi:F-type H+-transporting ATPase subunit delta